MTVRMTLAQKIQLEGHGIKVPDDLCSSIASLALNHIQDQTKGESKPLPDYLQDVIQDDLTQEARYHARNKDLEPSIKRIER